ncbi:MAG: prepilin-type N-terminal cleavage/methylation domain-containing protein [Verrucomicrobiota bacterium]|nr:prepilin-type N-terminal cleavage/methylation domain-containing protein [Verrucomicrobiota bacterium]
MNKSTHRGFTLMEIVVVVAIIGILAGLLLPTMAVVQNKMVRSKCKNNLRQLNLGFIVFATDHSMKFPWCLPKRELAEMEFSYYGAWDTRELYGNAIIRTMLGTAEVLVSPCDPERKEKSDIFAPTFRFVDIIPSEVCSYGIAVGTPLEHTKDRLKEGQAALAQEYGADYTHTQTILTMSRNIIGPINDGDSLSDQSGRNPIAKVGQQSAIDWTKRANWVGIDDPDRDLANKRGMANLKGGMGQVGLSDGSAHMYGMKPLHDQINEHHRDLGVTYRGVPSPIIDTPNDDLPGKHSDWLEYEAAHPEDSRTPICAACSKKILRNAYRVGIRYACAPCYRKIQKAAGEK